MSNSLVLIDTSIWVPFLRKSPPPAVRDEVDRLLAEDRVAIFPMIRLELLGGTRSTKEFQRLGSRLDALHQIPVDEANWGMAAELAFKLRRRGKGVPYTDILIGSAAILADVPLLHADRHFDLMAKDTDLRVRSLVSVVR
ncbi:PIN domain nuclease [Chloroflexota bacterium]